MKPFIRAIIPALAAVCGVSLSCTEVELPSEAVFITGTANDPLVKFAIDELPSTYSVSVTSTVKASEDVQVKLAVDTELVDSYNMEMGLNYFPIPDGAYTISGDEVTIASGQAVSTAVTVSVVDDSRFVVGRVYVIPVTIVSVSGAFGIIESSRTIYLKVSRTLRFNAPYVGVASMAYQFLFSNPITSLPAYTWEVKIYAEKFRDTNADGTTRVCSFGGDDTSVEGGAIDDGGFKCDQNLIRFGEGTDEPNRLHITTKQAKMSSNTLFDAGRWYSVAIVNDGTTMTLYVDGEKDNSVTVAPYVYTLYGVQIGMPSNGYQSSQLFYGRLAEMRLWTRALTAREIRAGVCGVDPDTEGLVAYWPMNEGHGNVFYDLSPNHRDISYTNGINVGWIYDDTNKCVE
ncbi:MAG: DUF1735 and LamG domain-containing protein [Bacteroidales bacterium]|nr:DUF1735 and LamG domain-containing protein [Bacteroidales bacterium]